MKSAPPIKKLADLTLKVGSGSTPRGGEAVYKPAGIPLIRSMNVHFGGFKSEGLVYLDEHEAAKLDNVIVHDNDVLLNITGASIGRVTTAPKSLEGARVNQHVCIIRPKPELNPKYLGNFFASPEQQARVMNVQVGATRQALTKATILNWEVPVPSPAEQQEIVAEIEKQFTRLEAGAAALRRVQAKLKRYRASVLKAACEGRLVPTEAELARAEGRSYEPADHLLARILTERRQKWSGRGTYKEPVFHDNSNLPSVPESWTMATIEQLTRLVATGATPLRGKTDFWQGGTIPWVTSSALNKNFVSEALEFITKTAIQKTNAKLFPVGTLLVALYGEGKTRGKVSELQIEAATNQACAALLFDSTNSALKPYLKLFLQNNYEAVRLLASGGVQPNLSLSIMKETIVPLPPLAEQRRIVTEVERRLSVVDQLEVVVTANLQRATPLRQSILQIAFSGLNQ